MTSHNINLFEFPSNLGLIKTDYAVCQVYLYETLSQQDTPTSDYGELLKALDIVLAY